jgi:FkbM family methyltransferase
MKEKPYVVLPEQLHQSKFFHLEQSEEFQTEPSNNSPEILHKSGLFTRPAEMQTNYVIQSTEKVLGADIHKVYSDYPSSYNCACSSPKYPNFCVDRMRLATVNDEMRYISVSQAIQVAKEEAERRKILIIDTPNENGCTAKFSTKQSQFFDKYYVTANKNIPLHGPLYCNEDFILDHFYRISPNPDKTFLEIGANKGFDLVKVYAKWTNFTVNTVWKLHHLHPGCPWYADIDKFVFPRVYAFEPQKATFEALQDLVRYLPLCNMHLYNMAVSGPNSPTTMTFTHGVAGDESAHLLESVQKNMKQEYLHVNVTTVNKIMSSHDITHVHGLFVDTEGSDFRVLLGAVTELKSKLIDFLVFEAVPIMRNEDGPVSLKTVIAYLESNGYMSYYIGPLESLIQLSPLESCWNEAYENGKIRPANILAVRADWELAKSFVIPFLVGALKY